MKPETQEKVVNPKSAYQKFVKVGTHIMPQMVPAGIRLWNEKRRYILCYGARKTGKTLGIANKFIRHAVEHDGAVCPMIAKTTKVGKIGTWSDLLGWVLPGWIEVGLTEIVEGPKTDVTSKMEFVRIRNQYGGVSELQLHSLNNERDVLEKFKSARFSCIWLSEADVFEDRQTLVALSQQLRSLSPTIPFEEHQLLLDANPPDEGEDHWLHDVFFKAAEPGNKHHITGHDESHSALFFPLYENRFLPVKEREELENSCRFDDTLYAQWVEGKWVKRSSKGWFDDVFVQNIHVVGNVTAPDPKQHEVITPWENAEFLITGSDIGDVNHATGFWCPRLISSTEGSDGEPTIAFDAFDEVVSLGRKVLVRDFATIVWDRIRYWNDWLKKQNPKRGEMRWIHVADTSLFESDSRSGTSDAAEFWEASDGGIRMVPAKKGANSVIQRIKLIRRLLFEQRLFVSANCHATVDWLRFLKPDTSAGGTTKAKIFPRSEFKHKFDADTYALAWVMNAEMNLTSAPRTGVREIVSVGG